MNKIIKDGMVAVLVSPCFGAGWSTWNDEEKRDVLCMDADIVQAVLDGSTKKAAEIAVAKFPGDNYTCVLGADDLVVEWVPQGAQFEIEEYDGSESLHIIGDRRYATA